MSNLPLGLLSLISLAWRLPQKLNLSPIGLAHDEVAVMFVVGGRPSCPVSRNEIHPHEGIETNVS